MTKLLTGILRAQTNTHNIFEKIRVCLQIAAFDEETRLEIGTRNLT